MTQGPSYQNGPVMHNMFNILASNYTNYRENSQHVFCFSGNGINTQRVYSQGVIPKNTYKPITGTHNILSKLENKRLDQVLFASGSAKRLDHQIRPSACGSFRRSNFGSFSIQVCIVVVLENARHNLPAAKPAEQASWACLWAGDVPTAFCFPHGLAPRSSQRLPRHQQMHPMPFVSKAGQPKMPSPAWSFGHPPFEVAVWGSTWPYMGLSNVPSQGDSYSRVYFFVFGGGPCAYRTRRWLPYLRSVR